MMKILRTVLILTIFVIPPAPIHAGQDKVYFKKARSAATDGNEDAAYMNYRRIQMDFPQSRYFNTSLFAGGEYHYWMENYGESSRLFELFLESNTDGKESVFALVFLMAIAEDRNHSQAAEEIRRQILARQNKTFLFKDTKEYAYVSPLNRTYKVIYEVDQIQFFIDGKLFETVRH